MSLMCRLVSIGVLQWREGWDTVSIMNQRSTCLCIEQDFLLAMLKRKHSNISVFEYSSLTGHINIIKLLSGKNQLVLVVIFMSSYDNLRASAQIGLIHLDYDTFFLHDDSPC